LKKGRNPHRWESPTNPDLQEKTSNTLKTYAQRGQAKTKTPYPEEGNKKKPFWPNCRGGRKIKV